MRTRVFLLWQAELEQSTAAMHKSRDAIFRMSELFQQGRLAADTDTGMNGGAAAGAAKKSKGKKKA
jgi:hypothetical protein